MPYDRFIAAGLKPRQIRALAEVVRQNVSYGSRACFPILPYLEHELFELDGRAGFAVSESDVMGDDLARVHLPERIIEVREDVYFRAAEGSGTDRFTLAHELGHYLMHGELRLARSSDRQIKLQLADAEQEADFFAAELLMPLALIRQMRTVEDLVNVFGVSLPDAQTHLSRLSKMSDLVGTRFGDRK